MLRSRSFTALFALALTTAACNRGSDGDGGTDDDTASAQSASTAVESGGEVTYVSGYYSGTGISLRARSIEEDSATVLIALEANITADLEVPACVSIDTDNLTYLEATFTACTGAQGHVTLNGSIRAELSFATEPCGPLQCPVAVLYDVTTTGLTVNESSISGSWQVRDPIAAGASASWTGEVTITTPRRTVTASGSASWTKSAECVTYDYDAEIEGSLGRSLTVAADAVTRCMGSCPSAGTVTLTTAAGASLAWSYDGEGAATVTGSGGATFDVELACAQ